MAFTFQNFDRTERVELGTIASVVGVGGSVAPIPKNLIDTTKQVCLVLTKKDGTSATVVLSEKVSKLFRNKEVTLGQVVGFPIIEATSKTGKITNTVAIPSREGTTLTHIAIKSLKQADYEPEANEPVDLSELIAL